VPEADPESVARQICLNQLEFAPRTRAELAATLAKRGVPAEAAEAVLSRFAEVGLIDDALFAELWVTSRHNGRGLAGRALSQELRRKGVDDEAASAALATLGPDQERATARALVDRKLRSTRGLAVDARVRRLAGMLARKGYSGGLAFAVVREALAAEGEDERLLEGLADLE
jgi:regulatory protein